MEIKTSLSGGNYVEALPVGVKVASMDDFFDEKGRLIINKAYLVQSQTIEKRWWANRVKKGFPYGPGLVEFIESGFVYVFTNNEMP